MDIIERLFLKHLREGGEVGLRRLEEDIRQLARLEPRDERRAFLMNWADVLRKVRERKTRRPKPNPPKT